MGNAIAVACTPGLLEGIAQGERLLSPGGGRGDDEQGGRHSDSRCYYHMIM
jgi:hypothetical protein